MKKSMIYIAAILFMGTLATQAQTPSTPSTTSPSMQQQPRSSDWSKVETSQTPAPVQQTLREDKYKGWENDGLYFNKSTKQYSVDIRTGATPGLYYFDQSGKTVTGTGTTSSQGTTGSRPAGSTPNSSPGSTAPPTAPGQSTPKP